MKQLFIVALALFFMSGCSLLNSKDSISEAKLKLEAAIESGDAEMIENMFDAEQMVRLIKDSIPRAGYLAEDQVEESIESIAKKLSKEKQKETTVEISPSLQSPDKLNLLLTHPKRIEALGIHFSEDRKKIINIDYYNARETLINGAIFNIYAYSNNEVVNEYYLNYADFLEHWKNEKCEEAYQAYTKIHYRIRNRGFKQNTLLRFYAECYPSRYESLIQKLKNKYPSNTAYGLTIDMNELYKQNDAQYKVLKAQLLQM